MTELQEFASDTNDVLDYLRTTQLTAEEWAEARGRLEELLSALQSLEGLGDPEAYGKKLDEAEVARAALEKLGARLAGKAAVRGLDPQDEHNILIDEVDQKLVELGGPSGAKTEDYADQKLDEVGGAYGTQDKD